MVKKPKIQKAVCQNCTWTGETNKTTSVADLEMRVAPGEIVPVGACPKCGAVCHLVGNFTFVGPTKLKLTAKNTVGDGHAALEILRQLGWNLAQTN